VAVEKVIGEGDKGGALAAGGHVGGTEIADGGDAGAGGDDRGLADLHSGRSGCAEERDGFALMEDGLAVGGDQVEGFQRNTEFFAGGDGSFGEEFAEAEI
jgi:hypothetical protein